MGGVLQGKDSTHQLTSRHRTGDQSLRDLGTRPPASETRHEGVSHTEDGGEADTQAVWGREGEQQEAGSEPGDQVSLTALRGHS